MVNAEDNSGVNEKPKTSRSGYDFTKQMVIKDGMAMPPVFWSMKDTIREAIVKPGDVWVAPYPKSGTTWMQEMTWLLTHNLDYEGAKKELHLRSPNIEYCCWPHNFLGQKKLTMSEFEEIAASSGGRRVIKTHLQWELLPEKLQQPNSPAKIIYVTRSPKDVCVSFYYYLFITSTTFPTAGVTLDEFCGMFMSDYIIHGPYWKHVGGFWAQRNNPNVLIVKFEDMKKNLEEEVRRVAKFLEVPVPTGGQMEKLLDHLSFESMKKNPAIHGKKSENKDIANSSNPEIGRFMRKGIVGDGKQKMSPEMVKIFDEWIRTNAEKIGMPIDEFYLI